MENTEKLQKKLASIKRGAYWFGIIGRLNMLGGTFIVLFGIIALFGSMYIKPDSHVFVDSNALMFDSLLYGFSHVVDGKLLGVGISGLINGYLFLLGRDAFEAIEELIREVGEIV